MTTPYLQGATLPPPCLGDTIARMQEQLDSQTKQLRILGELVEALRGEVERLNSDLLALPRDKGFTQERKDFAV